MKIEFELYRASVHLAKGYRQIQKASDAIVNNDPQIGARHLDRALTEFGEASESIAEAKDNAYDKAGHEIDKGNIELEKSIDEYCNGNDNSATRHLNSAVKNFDNALDLVG